MARRNTVFSLKRQRTFLLTLLASLFIAIIGGFLIFLVNDNSLWSDNSVWRSFFRDLGSLLIVSVALALVWELSGKRSLVDEVYSKANIAQSIQGAGLTEVVFRGQDIDWENLFNSAREVDLFFAYNSWWRTSNEVRLNKLAARKGVRIRLILPDVSDTTTAADLARRFSRTVDRLRI